MVGLSSQQLGNTFDRGMGDQEDRDSSQSNRTVSGK